MFITWLKENRFSDDAFSMDLFPDVTDRSYWEAHADPAYIARAESFLSFEWPVIKATDFMEFKRSGNRRIMEKPHFDRREALIALVVAELMENRGRFLPQIVNGIFAICEETSWALSAHWYREVRNIPLHDEPYVDLEVGETASTMALILRMLRASLSEFCPEILYRMSYELERRVKEPYLTHRDFKWMGYTKKKVNNWNPWILSNVLTVFLLTEEDEERKHAALEKLFSEIQFYYDFIPNDGGCDEGATYWGHAGGSLFEFLWILKKVSSGKLDLFGDEKIRNIGSFIRKVYIGDGYFINFADGSPRGAASVGYQVYAYGVAIKDTEMMWLGRDMILRQQTQSREAGKLVDDNAYYLRRTLFGISMKDRIAEVEAPQGKVIEALPDTQVATLRCHDWFLGVKGGHNRESHNHNDVGSFVLYDACKPVLIDVGVGDYTGQTFSPERYSIWTMQSAYHNLPTVNGVMQKNGREFFADDFACKENQADISFASAYPEEAEVKEARRQITLSENEILLEDSFVFADTQGSQVSEHLMSALLPVIEEGEVLLDRAYRIESENAEIRVEAIDISDSVKLSKIWKQKELYRISFDYENTQRVCLKIRRIKP